MKESGFVESHRMSFERPTTERVVMEQPSKLSDDRVVAKLTLSVSGDFFYEGGGMTNIQADGVS